MITDKDRSKYKVFLMSEMESQGFDFQTLTYALLGKGPYVLCEYDDSIGWFPMCGENRFKTESEANQAMLNRIQMSKEMEGLFGPMSESTKSSLEEALAFADAATKMMEEDGD